MNNQSKLFRKVNEIILFDDNMIESAKECFQDYVEKGIILTTNFEENKWATTNEYSNVSFIFNLNKFQYKRFYEQVFQLSFDDFVTYLKSFIVLSMEHHVLITLQAFLRDIKKIAHITQKLLFCPKYKNALPKGRADRIVLGNIRIVMLLRQLILRYCQLPFQLLVLLQSKSSLLFLQLHRLLQ